MKLKAIILATGLINCIEATYLPVKAGNVDAVVNFVLDYQ